MSTFTLAPVILLGGAGSRLWPMSREAHPKQFIKLIDHQSFFQHTLLRAMRLLSKLENIVPLKPVLLCNQQYEFLLRDQLEEIGLTECDILFEPVSRNTAAAVTAAGLYLKQRYAEEVLMLVLPSDHLMRDEEILLNAINHSCLLVKQQYAITFGIKPTHPETGYGYIKISTPVNDHLLLVEKFIEKPNFKTAQEYVKSGFYLWNSGMFLLNTHSFLKEIKKFEPELYDACNHSLGAAKIFGRNIFLNANHYEQCRNVSIDYAFMERTDRLAVAPLGIAWSDVGSWCSLADVFSPDEKGNVILGDVHSVDNENCYFHSENRLICALGVKDQIIVETKDAVLVANKSRAQDVRHLVANLKREARTEVNFHKVVHRPWGTYEVLDETPAFKVKKIIIRPRAQLSLQSHEFRAEHWVVVKGQATVTRGDEQLILKQNESTYIPAKMKHRLANNTESNLEIIEVQTGDRLSEEDIVRYEDQYGRVEFSSIF